MPKIIQRPRGTQDILPIDQKYWRAIQASVEKVLTHFNFGRIETPMFESEDTFLRPIGQYSDIVEKEMYEVKRLSDSKDPDEGNQRLVLRPEMTTAVARSFIENGLLSWPQPVKLWYFGPAFRYDRPQKGRYRQFFQYGFEIFGDASATADALVILAVWQILSELKLDHLAILEINTIGDKNCRPKIRKTLGDYFKNYTKELCADCQRRLSTNPLRILDCKTVGCQPIIDQAPTVLDLVCELCKNHFRLVLEHLDDLDIGYDLNPRLVRGLDYYTRTTFEIRAKDDERRQSSLGGGGRYDELVVMMGGQSTPGIGFAGGVERLIELMIDRGLKVADRTEPKICVVQFGQLARRKSLVLVAKLANLGYSTVAAFDKDSLNAQLKYANRMGVAYSLIIGQKEALENEVIVRNMSDGSQETVSVKKLDEVLKRKVKQ